MQTTIRRFNNRHDLERVPVRRTGPFLDTCLRGNSSHLVIESSTFMVRDRAVPAGRRCGTRLTVGWRKLVTDLLVSHSAPVPPSLTFSCAAAQTTCFWRVADPRAVRDDYRDGVLSRSAPTGILNRKLTVTA